MFDPDRLTNSRIEGFENGRVTLRYRDNRTQQIRRICLGADEFIHRFLHHVLPQGFPRVRHYSLASSAHSQDRAYARRLLTEAAPPAESDRALAPSLGTDSGDEPAPLCLQCHRGHLHVIRTLRPRRKFSP